MLPACYLDGPYTSFSEPFFDFSQFGVGHASGAIA